MATKRKSRYSTNYTRTVTVKKPFPTWAMILIPVLCAVLIGGVVLGVLFFGGAASGSYNEEQDRYAHIAIEDYGTIVVELRPDVAPITVENFVSLAKSGFYDGLTFHRIMEGFMMQGGDPEGDGTGGYVVDGVKQTIEGEFKLNGHQNNLSHTRGVISMARNGDPYYDSASSQFFIVHEDSTFLDGSYAAFGVVVSGIEIVDAICEAAEPTNDNGKIPASEQPVITSITIKSTAD